MNRARARGSEDASRHRGGRLARLLAALALVAVGAGCKGDSGRNGAAGGGPPPTPPEVARGEAAPGVLVAITSVAGGSGSGGAFRAGDRLRVTFTVRSANGAAWELDRLALGTALVSGPTFNYQRVIPEQRDVLANAVRNADGSYTYTFPVPIPSTYLAPLNDSASFGPGDGELAGQALLSGTYTVGLHLALAYTVEGESFLDVGEHTADFLFGSATTIRPREVVKRDNCNRCHDSLRYHDEEYREVATCVLCHTSGAEDLNDPLVEGGTPGRSVDFRVLIHKLHNGYHLPSVMGMETFPAPAPPPLGSRNYAGTPTPYRLVDGDGEVHDYSEVASPIWPSLTFPMPRDSGHSTLNAMAQAMEDRQRSGVVACDVCHGDPDAGGPLMAPAQGQVAYVQPTRRACGSCHDDVDWPEWYTANNQPMPPQLDDSACILCHRETGDFLAVIDGHRHPLLSPAENPGLNFELLSVDEAGANDGDGTFDTGEKLALTFTITDDLGFDVAPAEIATLTAVLSGPTSAMNLVANARIPTGALVGAQPWTVNLPTAVRLEFLGDATAGADVFATALAPHWNVPGATTTVWERTATGVGSTLSSASTAPQNWLDVADGSLFARNDFVVVDDGTASEEYLLVQQVEGDRLWFASPYQTDAEPGAPTAYEPGTELDHAAGATVDVVALTQLVEGAGNDYVLTASTGTITEQGGAFGDGDALVASYTSDLVLPARYPLALNDSPDLGETWGEWRGKSLVDGTYRLALWSSRSLAVTRAGETTTYRAASTSVSADLLVGNAGMVEPYDLASAASCYDCHEELYFHGGNHRGFDACVQCHATAGAEDRPRYRAPNAPATPGESVEFVRMLHRIHHGAALENAVSYTVVGFGPPNAYPDNFSEHTYEDVRFPAQPDGTRHCATCHGEGSDAWQVPSSADHPTEQGLPARPWRSACGSCHDGAAANAHIDDQTSPGGLESCATCHGPGAALDVETVHTPRF